MTHRVASTRSLLQGADWCWHIVECVPAIRHDCYGGCRSLAQDWGNVGATDEATTQGIKTH